MCGKLAGVVVRGRWAPVPHRQRRRQQGRQQGCGSQAGGRSKDAAYTPRRTPASQPPASHQPRSMAAAAAAEAAAEAEAPVEDPATAFDWKLGLVLAGCAFEAYNDVDAEGTKSPSLRMRTMGGTEVTFVDKDFLRRKYAGLMQVTVKSAADLPVADWWPGAKSDPYAVVGIGDSAGATAVVTQNLHPRWDEMLHLFVSDPDSQRLTVRVLDADVGKSDDLLGGTMRGLQDLVDGGTHELELPLRGPKGPAGTLSLSCRFLPFDDVLAQEAAAGAMGGPVLGSPPATIMSSDWRTLQKTVMSAADTAFDPVAYVDDPETDTQAWLFWNPGTREVCIAFRGTEQVKWKDILTDLRLVPASLDPEGLAEAPTPWKRRQPQAGTEGPSVEAAVAALQSKRMELRATVAEGLQARLQDTFGDKAAGATAALGAAAAAARTAGSEFEASGAGAAGKGQQGQGQPAMEADEDEDPVWVHGGFLEAYASVRAVVLRLLDTALAGETEPWTLYVTGHSLGAALSTLCSYDCARRSWRTTAHRPRLVHYNYGSPRVGNRAFAEEFDALVPNTWRVANSKDAVTLVPRMLGYCHVGHKAELGPDGQLTLTRDSSRSLGEGVDAAGVALAAAVNLPALAETMMAAQEALEAAKRDSKDSSNAGSSSNTNSSSSSSSLDEAYAAGKPALMSAAAAVAAAAMALREGQAAAEGGGVGEMEGHSADDVRSLLEEEMQAMQRLLDGSALTEHLEPLYLENLTAAITKLGKDGQKGGQIGE